MVVHDDGRRRFLPVVFRVVVSSLLLPLLWSFLLFLSGAIVSSLPLQDFDGSESDALLTLESILGFSFESFLEQHWFPVFAPVDPVVASLDALVTDLVVGDWYG